MEGSDALIDRVLAPSLRFATRASALLAPDASHRPTPCASWNVAELARHLLESLHVVTTSLNFGITPPPPAWLAHWDDLSEFEQRLGGVARDLLAAARRGRRPSVSIDGVDLDRGLVLIVASLEASVHSWDLLAGAGTPLPLPAPLARNLGRVLPAVLDTEARGSQFAPPVPVPDGASPSDRILAAVGRSPDRWSRGGNRRA
ncbi:uncharacterized protein (TIGR03086 family) [Nocardioides thalensis]|uniref:Uncharacterized protein (TIGR03086 family) n=1 Tax=Nocardioides thalensis TaxID=1914755 RepID=A0A853C629_9ACTN|nr:maleylpyruvate isomerase N-terminal domain-containing protein [Nocardioides thalensis]NYJ02944.1 uncharacterized protein (TIGR03086 family) [Nocardioides thalensis]